MKNVKRGLQSLIDNYTIMAGSDSVCVCVCVSERQTEREREREREREGENVCGCVFQQYRNMLFKIISR